MRIIKLIPTGGRVIEKIKNKVKKENKNKVVNYICPISVSVFIFPL